MVQHTSTILESPTEAEASPYRSLPLKGHPCGFPPVTMAGKSSIAMSIKEKIKQQSTKIRSINGTILAKWTLKLENIGK